MNKKIIEFWKSNNKKIYLVVPEYTDNNYYYYYDSSSNKAIMVAHCKFGKIIYSFGDNKFYDEKTFIKIMNLQAFL